MSNHKTSANVKRINLISIPILVELASYLLMLLFLYAAISKLVILSEFQQQMMESPLLPRQLIPFLAFFVPISEIVIAWMLVFEKTKKFGFYLSFLTMLTFTLYLITLITVAENAPCACGGILGSFGYFEHIAFNTTFTGIALFGCIKS